MAKKVKMPYPAYAVHKKGFFALSNNCIHLSCLSAENRILQDFAQGRNLLQIGQKVDKIYLVNMPVPQNTWHQIAKSAKIIKNSLKMLK